MTQGTEASSVRDYNGDQASVDSRGKRQSTPFVYPLTYSHELVDFSVWDLTFMTRLSSGLTMNQFHADPRIVLDLGCGCGSWAIEMARKYPECRIVGLDIFNVQPKLQNLAVTANLSDRIMWMQGDFLRPLEFLDCTFDLVRISYASLGIPEDRWQGLLEEIHRVLIVGGTLEVIEEDLIFPCSSEKPSKPIIARLMPQPETISSRNSTRTQTHSVYSCDMWADMKTPTSTENPSRILLEGQELDQYAPPRPYELDRGENPLDHSKLKAAWEEMLSERFLTSQVTSVLPLYLSTIFQDYRAIPSLDILLPPRGSTVAPLSNSGCRRFSDDGMASAVEQLVNPMLYRHLGQATVKEEPDTSSVLTGSDAPSHFISSWAPMHLARMVAMIKGCKENIWMTYEKLYGEGPAVVDNEEVRVLQKEQPKGPQPGEELKPVEEKPKIVPKDKNDKTTTRDDFETAWFNWESDMTDRIGMRNLMQSTLQWNEPSGDPPEWRVWRNRTNDSFDGSSIRRSSASAQAKPRSDVCRSVRGFVAWKQSPKESETSNTSHRGKGSGMPQDDRPGGHAHTH